MDNDLAIVGKYHHWINLNTTNTNSS